MSLPDPPLETDLLTSARMRRVRRRDTDAELALRRELHRRGLRYRIHVPALPSSRSRPDVVFRAARVAVFVDGCFWHGCPEHGTDPRRNGDFWRRKIASNRERDARTIEELEAAGWTVLRVWNHDDPAEMAKKIEGMVRSHR